jgi:hypothetical protein
MALLPHPVLGTLICERSRSPACHSEKAIHETLLVPVPQIPESRILLLTQYESFQRSVSPQGLLDVFPLIFFSHVSHVLILPVDL